MGKSNRYYVFDIEDKTILTSGTCKEILKTHGITPDVLSRYGRMHKVFKKKYMMCKYFGDEDPMDLLESALILKEKTLKEKNKVYYKISHADTGDIYLVGTGTELKKKGFNNLRRAAINGHTVKKKYKVDFLRKNGATRSRNPKRIGDRKYSGRKEYKLYKGERPMLIGDFNQIKETLRSEGVNIDREELRGVINGTGFIERKYFVIGLDEEEELINE